MYYNPKCRRGTTSQHIPLSDEQVFDVIAIVKTQRAELKNLGFRENKVIVCATKVSGPKCKYHVPTGPAQEDGTFGSYYPFNFG